MASETAEVPKTRRLPPLSSPTEDTTTSPKRVKKKKKKPAATAGGDDDTVVPEENKPKRRRTPASSESANKNVDGEEEDKPKASPRKKKTTKSTKKDDQEVDNAETEEVTGSKASLLAKEVSGSKASILTKDDDGTPRKKKKKKKPKPAENGSVDSGWASELKSLEEDIIPSGKQVDDEEKEQEIQHPHVTSAAILHSQHTDKLYIETNRGFKSETKAKLAKKQAALEEERQKDLQVEKPKKSTIDFALGTHAVFKTFCLFLHGITAGISLWNIVIVYVLSYHTNIDFLEHYQPLALPVQCMFYILLVLCTVSACDRSDIGNPTRRSVIRALTLQSTAVAVLVYLVALVLSLSAGAIADKMNLYYRYKYLWEDAQGTDNDLELWKRLNTARCIAAIVGWIVLSIKPTADRLKENLENKDDPLASSLELDPSAA